MSVLRLTALAALAAVGALAAPAVAQERPPRAWVITIHGGGWHEVGRGPTARMDGDVARLRSWGYGTVNVDYRAGPLAFPDVLEAYARLRARVGPGTPVCAMGASAGGQLALMLAIRRPAVACVITHGAPTLLSSLSDALRARARWAFGPRLDRWSPAMYRLRTPLLLEQATGDRLVPLANTFWMRAAAPRSRVIWLEGGRVPWTHASVDAGRLSAARAAERRLLARWTARWSRADVPPPPLFAGMSAR